VSHNSVDEDYRIYTFYQKSGVIYCKYADYDDLSSWTTLSIGTSTAELDYWDVSQLVDRNFLLFYCKLDGSNYDLVTKRYAEGQGMSTEMIMVNDNTNRMHVAVPQESRAGFGDAVGCDHVLANQMKSRFLYSSIAPKITAMNLEVVTTSETGILEGDMYSYTNAGLDAEEVDYSMNREDRLTMIQNIQKTMPVAAGSTSPNPFWDIALRVVGNYCYLDVNEELGSTKAVTITHSDEESGDMEITILDKKVDRGEIINALTVVGGGWSSSGVQVIPVKNVATSGVQAGTETQFAGTILNKRMSTNLTIENIAYGILNITQNPRVTITLAVKGDSRNLFTLNDKITVVSERYNIDQTLKIRGMKWSVTGRKTTLRLELDNGSMTLDKYMVELINNMNSLSFNAQGELQRPPIYLNKNFSKDEPAILKFFVPATKSTKKALLYVKTQKYTSYENNIINEFGYYPEEVKLHVDGEFHEGFGGRGNETTAVDIQALDITSSMDLDGDGLVDAGEHVLRFTSVASTNNTNGLGRIEAYLVLLESD